MEHVFLKLTFLNRIILRFGRKKSHSTAINRKKSYDYTIQKIVFKKAIVYTACFLEICTRRALVLKKAEVFCFGLCVDFYFSKSERGKLMG